MALTISLQEAQAWTDKSKLILSTLDMELEASVTSQVINRVAQVYDTSSWTSSETVPLLIHKIIAMQYVGWLYQRTYSEDEETNSYGLLLLSQAETLIESIISGTTLLTDATLLGGGIPGTQSSISFYPTDASSALEPTSEDTSLGASAFSMGMIW